MSLVVSSSSFLARCRYAERTWPVSFYRNLICLLLVNTNTRTHVPLNVTHTACFRVLICFLTGSWIAEVSECEISQRSIWKSSHPNHFHLVLMTSGPHSAIPIYLSFLTKGTRFGSDTIRNPLAVAHTGKKKQNVSISWKEKWKEKKKVIDRHSREKW